MHHIMLSFAVCSAVQFAKLSHKSYDFRKKKNVILYKMRDFIFPYKFFPKYFSLYEELSEMLS
jgi:hypothetical protein